MQPRFPELDLLRSAAVMGMIVYHLAYDLEFFYGRDIGVLEGTWWLTARSVAVLFLLLVGTSFSISWERTVRNSPSPHGGRNRGIGAYPKYLRHGIVLLLLGLLVSLATHTFDARTYVRFGILHLIGTSVLLLPFFTHLREWTIVLGLLTIMAGRMISGTMTGTALLIPLGLPPAFFDSIDYFPLLPWFGVVLIGHGLGHTLYVRRTPPLRAREPTGMLRLLTLPGRYALWIYLLHQPILLLALRLWMG